MKQFLRDPARETDPEFLAASEMKQFMEANAEAIEYARKAAKMPDCNWGLDYSKGNRMPMPHLEKMRTQMKVLALSIPLRARHGDWAGVRADLEAMLSGARHVAKDHVLLCRLVNNWSESIAAIGALPDAVRQSRASISPPKDDDLAALQRILREHIARRGTIADTYRGEQAILTWTMDLFGAGQLATMDLSSDRGRTRSLPLVLSLVYESDRSLCLDLTGSMADRSPSGDFDGPLDPLPRPEHAKVARWRAILSNLLLPVDASSVQCELRSLAALRQADLLVAYERYRLRHGKFASTQEFLVPDFMSRVPRDPFTGNTFRVVVSDGIWISIVATGPNKEFGPEPPDEGLSGKPGWDDVRLDLKPPAPIAPKKKRDRR